MRQEDDRPAREDLLSLVDHDCDDAGQIGGRGQRAAEIVERDGLRLAARRGQGLLAGARREVAHDQSKQEQAKESQHILRIADREREVGRHEQEVKCKHAQNCAEHGGGTPQVERCDEHYGQVGHHEIGRLDPCARRPADEGCDGHQRGA